MADVLGYGQCNHDWNQWQQPQEEHDPLSEYTLKLEERVEDVTFEVQCLRAVMATILQATLQIPNLPPTVSAALRANTAYGRFSKRNLYWYGSDYTTPILTQTVIIANGALTYDARPMEFIVDVYGRPWTRTKELLSWLQAYFDQAASEGRIGDLRSQVDPLDSLPQAFIEAAAAEAEQIFPELKLCHDRWKFRAAAASFIPAWKRHREVLYRDRNLKRKLEMEAGLGVGVEAEVNAAKRRKIEETSPTGMGGAPPKLSVLPKIALQNTHSTTTTAPQPAPSNSSDSVTTNLPTPPTPSNPHELHTQQPAQPKVHLKIDTSLQDRAPGSTQPTPSSSNGTLVASSGLKSSSNSSTSLTQDSPTTLCAPGSACLPEPKTNENSSDTKTVIPPVSKEASASSTPKAVNLHRLPAHWGETPPAPKFKIPHWVKVEHCKQRWIRDNAHLNKTPKEATIWWRALNPDQKHDYKYRTQLELCSQPRKDRNRILPC